MFLGELLAFSATAAMFTGLAVALSVVTISTQSAVEEVPHPVIVLLLTKPLAAVRVRIAERNDR